jgi:hypothetical protein
MDRRTFPPQEFKVVDQAIAICSRGFLCAGTIRTLALVDLAPLRSHVIDACELVKPRTLWLRLFPIPGKQEGLQ